MFAQAVSGGIGYIRIGDVAQSSDGDSFYTLNRSAIESSVIVQADQCIRRESTDTYRLDGVRDNQTVIAEFDPTWAGYYERAVNSKPSASTKVFAEQEKLNSIPPATQPSENARNQQVGSLGETPQVMAKGAAP